MRIKNYLLCCMLLGRAVFAELAVEDLGCFPQFGLHQFGDELFMNDIIQKPFTPPEHHNFIRIDESGQVHKIIEYHDFQRLRRDNLIKAWKIGDNYYYGYSPLNRNYMFLDLPGVDIYVSDGTEGNYRRIVEGPVYDVELYDGDFYYRKPVPLDEGDTTPYDCPKKLVRFDIATETEEIIPIYENEQVWQSPYPANIDVANGKLFFIAYVEEKGFEIHTYDGTNVNFVKDLYPGIRSGVGLRGNDEYVTPDGQNTYFASLFSDKRNEHYGMTPLLDKFWFFSFTPDWGLEVGCSDGTDSGTYILGDLNPDLIANANQEDGIVHGLIGDRIVFDFGGVGSVMHPSETGRELHITDGTPEGTHMITDLYPGPEGIELAGNELTSYNGHVYFRAHNQLWRTDGTEEGTHEFFALPQTHGTEPWSLVSGRDGYLYFFAVVEDEVIQCTPEGCSPELKFRAALFRSDGTVEGTQEIYRDRGFASEASALRYNRELTVTSNNIYFKHEEWAFGRLIEDEPPQIVTSPVVTGQTDQLYEYLVQATDPENQPITFTADYLPSWLTFTDNGNGSALLTGTPQEAGDYLVQITASTEINTPAVQQFSIHVVDGGGGGGPSSDVRVYSRDETITNSVQSTPRIYIVNEGEEVLTGFRMVYYFTVENGQIPFVDPFWAPNTIISLQAIDQNDYKIVYDVSGIEVQPNSPFPTPDGCVVGIRNQGWTPVDITDDYSNNQSSTFAVNENICVYDLEGELIWGIPKETDNLDPVANAGGDRTIIDPERDGESVILDGSSSYDTDGNIVSYEWLIDGEVVATGILQEITLQIGITNVTLKVTDNNGGVGYDAITIVVQGEYQDFEFTVGPDPVPQSMPTIVEYTIPQSMDGCTVRFRLHRLWDVIYYTDERVSGAAGEHHIELWNWSKGYFGGSGPWQVEFEVDGQIMDSKTITFQY